MVTQQAPQQRGWAEDLDIVLEAMRNSFGLLHGHLKRFIHESLDFSGKPQGEDEDTAFWVSLGVAPDIVETLVDLGLRWCKGCLYVSSKHRRSEDLVAKVSSAMVALFRFRKFSDSRWCTVGDSCRTLTAALCCGLGGLVALVRSSPTTSDFYIHGFERLGVDVLRYVAIAGMSSHFADSFLAELMADDRVARRETELQQVIVGEAAWLSNIGGPTWARLALVISGDYDHRRLRSECIESAVIAGGFVTRRVLRPLQMRPWNPTTSDIGENLGMIERQAQKPKSW